MKYMNIALVTGSIAVSMLMGCGASAGSLSASGPVQLVKASTLPGYESTTIGKAFGGTFQNGKWSSFETPKGATIVQFDGSVPVEVWTPRFGPTRFISRPSCISSLGLKEKMENEAQAASETKDAIIRAIGLEHWNNTDWNTAQEQYFAQDVEKEYIRTVQKQNLLAADNERKIAACVQTTPVPVQFQFLLSVDRKTFEVSYVDKKLVTNRSMSYVLDFIYR